MQETSNVLIFALVVSIFIAGLSANAGGPSSNSPQIPEIPRDADDLEEKIVQLPSLNNGQPALTDPIAPIQPSQATKPEFVPYQVIVLFHLDVPQEEIRSFEELYSLEIVSALIMFNAMTYRIPKTRSVEEIIHLLREDKRVKTVDLNLIMKNY